MLGVLWSWLWSWQGCWEAPRGTHVLALPSGGLAWKQGLCRGPWGEGLRSRGCVLGNVRCGEEAVGPRRRWPQPRAQDCGRGWKGPPEFQALPHLGLRPLASRAGEDWPVLVCSSHRKWPVEWTGVEAEAREQVPSAAGVLGPRPGRLPVGGTAGAGEDEERTTCDPPSAVSPRLGPTLLE